MGFPNNLSRKLCTTFPRILQNCPFPNTFTNTDYYILFCVFVFCQAGNYKLIGKGISGKVFVKHHSARYLRCLCRRQESPPTQIGRCPGKMGDFGQLHAHTGPSNAVLVMILCLSTLAQLRPTCTDPITQASRIYPSPDSRVQPVGGTFGHWEAGDWAIRSPPCPV